MTLGNMREHGVRPIEAPCPKARGRHLGWVSSAEPDILSPNASAMQLLSALFAASATFPRTATPTARLIIVVACS